MTATASAKKSKSGDPASRVPPEEQFWKHYSPHGEAPMSMAGSVALHGLIVGGMLLFGIYLAALFTRPQRTLPIEPVRLGGGGGHKKGGSTDGKGAPGATEDVGEPSPEAQPGEADAPPRATLTPVEAQAITAKFDADSVRRITKSANGKAMAGLQDALRRKLASGLGAKGEGGPGTGGGKDKGVGTGDGPGVGPGKATLNRREKRMLRWHMRFTANSGQEYLAQLRGLGAILAFPVTDGADPQFKVVRDLRPGGQLLDEDLSKIQRIYWIDDKPRSVADIVSALGLKLSPPARFVAFMPEELEQKLFNMERDYVERVLRQKFDEDRIDETQFRVVHTPAGYRPELISVSVR